MLHPDPVRIWGWAIPALGLNAALILARPQEGKQGGAYSALFASIGDCSYSLYLVHMFIVRPVTIVLGKLSVPLTPMVFALSFICVIGMSLVAAHFSYRWVERRSMKFILKIQRSA